MSARITGALTRWALLLHRFLRVRTGRLLLAGLLSTAVTGLLLAVPVIAGSGTGSPSVVFGASSSTPPGVDSEPAPAPGDQDAVFVIPGDTGAAPAPTAPAAPTTEQPTPSPDTVPPDTVPPDTVPPDTGGTGSSASSSSAAGTPPSSPGEPTPSPPSPTSDTAPPPAAPSSLEPGMDLLALLDQARGAAGCEPLVPDAALADLAQAHSRAMREEDDPDLSDVEGGSVLEHGASAAAVAQGESDPDDVLEDWLDDEDGAEAIRDCGLASAGIGQADGDGGPWWTLLLA